MELSLPLTIFLTLFSIMFLIVSGYCVGLWFRSTKGLSKLLENDATIHWSTKLAIYYGIAFFIFLVSSTFLSFVVLLAYKIWSLNV